MRGNSHDDERVGEDRKARIYHPQHDQYSLISQLGELDSHLTFNCGF